MEHAGGAGWPGAAAEMASRVPIRGLSGTKSEAQSTLESNQSSSQHACRLEKLALARSKLVQSFSHSPLRLETTNLAKTTVCLSKMPIMEHAGWPGAAPEMASRVPIPDSPASELVQRLQPEPIET